jgi:molybdate transport system substrate-binding protein
MHLEFSPGPFAGRLASLVVAALFMAGAASAADVRVMISAGFFSVYSELGPVFERATGHRLVTTRGSVDGRLAGVDPVAPRARRTADVVIMDGAAADELGRRGLARSDSKVEFARSMVGMVVRAGAAKPDIGSVEAFRNTLLTAKSIAYSDSGSGTFLSTTLFPKLGVAEQVAGKSRKVRGPPSGEPVAAVVARGEAEIGFQQVSELIHRRGGDPRRSDSGRVAAGIFLCRRDHQQRPTAGGGRCAFAFPRIAGRGAVIAKAGLAPAR